jgi:LuxR family quorum-sensing system transcriptional regulator CciR
MSSFDEIQQFVQAANRVTEFEELKNLLGSTVRSLGFDHYALFNHIRPSTSKEYPVRLHDYPDAFGELFREKGYLHDDPVLVACQKSAVPFTWEDVPQLVSLTPKQKEVFDAPKLAGISSSFIVPIHIPGESTASCTFAMRLGRDFPKTSFPAAQYVSCFAFEAARRVSQRMVTKKGRVFQRAVSPKLTRRQLDCVVLAGRGKSDRDIAQILGISNQTVHQHMEDAKRKYDVATRIQLIVCALFDNHVAFADLVN